MFTVGSGFVPLLPIYAVRLGGDPTVAGYSLSIGFLALSVGSILGGWVANRFGRRKVMLIAAGTVMVPISYGMGQVDTIIALVGLTAALWFLVGLNVTLLGLLTGLFVEKSERGRVFGIIGLAPSSAGILGGIASGMIVDQWGYEALFTLGALVYILLPLSGLLLADKPHVPRKLREGGTTAAPSILFSRVFLLLFFASVLAHIANSQIVLGRSLIMDTLQFDATAITGTGAVGALLSLPLPVFMGWLSDKLGRRPLIMICYFGSLVGLAVLASASSLWHFWAAMALQNMISAGFAVGSALITDLAPRDQLATPLSMYNASQFIGYVIGFAGSGTIIQALGMSSSLMIGGGLCLAAIGLLLVVRQPIPTVQIEGG